ncbi:hypothetical protein B0A50_04203 [Salinomyces thailandicus]|uniref:Uncharacterized protein n=1 Tax=Salinomyces thailandicus TaxID=706561 RepID=A0A4U0U028_9PEZI|nr:hypothetical protein B0A50_04203 [Salinomyces thailandica]
MQPASSSGSAPSSSSVLGKRVADESNLNDDQRFTKRFNLLSLDQAESSHGSSNYYIPVSPSLKPTINTRTDGGTTHGGSGEEGSMAVDDTKDRIYIGDLDAELADIESDEEKIIFLPDIEKKLSRLPRQVLSGKSDDGERQQLILYNVPKSLSLEEGQDSVRKAIIEARQRARDRAIEEARHEDMERRYGHSEQLEGVEPAHGYSGGYVEEVEDDPDAMDIG